MLDHSRKLIAILVALISVFAGMTIFAQDQGDENLETRIAAAKRDWQAQEVEGYVLQYTYASIWNTHNVTVVVADDLVKSLHVSCLPGLIDVLQCSVPAQSPSEFTVDGLFEALEAALLYADEETLSITFDETYTFPRVINYMNPDVLDSDWGIQVQTFEVIDPEEALPIAGDFAIATYSNTQANTTTPDATATLVAVRPERNADWTRVERDFDGVNMVLVPAGCFMMGSTQQQVDEQVFAGATHTWAGDQLPQHEQCFDEPFWIDKYEVTQAQFAAFNGVKARENLFKGDNRPVDMITWFEARDYCEQRRDVRLPTEREWEYAARGPDNLVYPWGDEFVADNVVYGGNSENITADVGSRPEGASWVGAHNMSGNVWEWVSSLYEERYPYSPDLESSSDTNGVRVLRGGAYSDTPSNLLRSASRGSRSPDTSSHGLGFRCARS